jgi:hypothetical protein
MVLKWVGRILYLIIVGVATYFLFSLALGNRGYEYLQEAKAKAMEDPNYLLSVVGVTQYGTDTKSFSEKAPLYSASYSYKSADETIEYRVNIEMYPVTYVLKKEVSDSLAIVIRDLVIKDDRALIDESTASNTITATFTFNTPITDPKKENEYLTYTASIGALYDNSLRLCLISEASLYNYKLSQDVDITKINLKFKNKEADSSDVLFLSLVNSLYPDTPEEDLFAANAEQRTFSVTHASYDLSTKYDYKVGGDFPKSSHVYYNADIEKELKSHNGVIVKYMAIYIPILLVITYLLFFNKIVVAIVRKKIDKKRAAKQAQKDKQEKEAAETEKIIDAEVIDKTEN